MGALRILSVAAVLLATMPVARADQTVATECTRTDDGYRCLYGPITVRTGANEVYEAVGAPPEPGWITSARATLVWDDGTRVPHHVVHLHHVLWLNPAERDMTCPHFPGDRFFASGKERTKLEMPKGYGYLWRRDAARFGSYFGPAWGLVAHLDAMHEDYTGEVFVRLDLGFVPEGAETQAMTNVRPVWFDIANCTTDSEFDVPEERDGRPFKTSWTYTMPEGGRFVAMGGHLHDRGLRLVLAEDQTGRRIFTSRAVYGNNHDRWYLTGMTTFSGAPGKKVEAGERVRLTAVYNDNRAVPGAMGIMLGYLAPPVDPPPRGYGVM